MPSPPRSSVLGSQGHVHVHKRCLLNVLFLGPEGLDFSLGDAVSEQKPEWWVFVSWDTYANCIMVDHVGVARILPPSQARGASSAFMTRLKGVLWWSISRNISTTTCFTPHSSREIISHRPQLSFFPPLVYIALILL